MPGSGPLFAYTRESANRLLPELQVLLAELRDAYTTLAGIAAATRSLARDNGGTAQPERRVAAEATVARVVAWLDAHGILLKDIERGLIDFPAVRDGRPVLLCWQLGEPAVDHWHEVSEGFAGRQRL